MQECAFIKKEKLVLIFEFYLISQAFRIEQEEAHPKGKESVKIMTINLLVGSG